MRLSEKEFNDSQYNHSKITVKSNKKKRNRSKSIYFALDIEVEFHNISRKVILNAFKQKIEK